MLKILLVHNFYASSAPSGENAVYFVERDLLKSHGHRVMEFTRSSDELAAHGHRGTLKGALSTPWNPFSAPQLRYKLEREKPDVMHVHNTFPLLSPAIFHAARGLNTGTVLTLHNYRIFCAAAIPMRNSTPCTECLDKHSVFPSLKYGCYRNSRLATLPLATMIGLHRSIGTWDKHVDAFIALTEFQRDKLAEAGLPLGRIHVKPHFYPDPPKPLPWQEREPKVIFLGRLGPEKGIDVLINAWKQWGPSAPALEFIGDGAERSRFEKTVKETGLAGKIHFWGQLPFSKVQKKMARARLLALPSLCFEGFPMAIREAFALGVPVAASRLGSIPCIVTENENGVLFTPGDSADLYRVVKGLWDAPERLCTMAKAARQEFESKYTAEKNHEVLMDIYDKAIAVRKERHSRH